MAHTSPPAKWQHLNPVYVGSRTWHSPCPRCGGEDRFFIQAEKNGYAAHGKCRQCELLEWADDRRRYSAEEMAAIQRKRKAEAQAAAEAQNRAVERFKRERLWKAYHDQIDPHGRAFWRSAGIPDALQDFWRIGYCPSRKYKYKKALYESPALSIPYFDENWEAQNMQFILLQCAGGGHYRWTKDLEPTIWRALPDEPLTGHVLVCEGFKKGAVAFTEIVAKGNNTRFQIVAIPSKTPTREMLAEFQGATDVTFCLDPDAYVLQEGETVPRVKKIAAAVPGSRIAHLPAKLDDLLVSGTWSASAVTRAIDLARYP